MELGSAAAALRSAAAHAEGADAIDLGEVDDGDLLPAVHTWSRLQTTLLPSSAHHCFDRPPRSASCFASLLTDTICHDDAVCCLCRWTNSLTEVTDGGDGSSETDRVDGVDGGDKGDDSAYTLATASAPVCVGVSRLMEVTDGGDRGGGADGNIGADGSRDTRATASGRVRVGGSRLTELTDRVGRARHTSPTRVVLPPAMHQAAITGGECDAVGIICVGRAAPGRSSPPTVVIASAVEFAAVPLCACL